MKIRTRRERDCTKLTFPDWYAWFEGREEWLIGHGATEGEAVADLLEWAWDSGELAA